MRVVICGTMPSQCNGYSKFVYNLAKGLAGIDDMSVFIFGFQRQDTTKEHEEERKLPSNVEVFDAMGVDKKDANGFGMNVIQDYIKKVEPDVVILYNDIIIVSAFIKILEKMDVGIKVVPYLDLVYNNHNLDILNFIASSVKEIIFFTEDWQGSFMKSIDEKNRGHLKTYVLEHGVCPATNYPVNKSVARAMYGMSEDDFMILNLNRNQPRKRWDVMISSFIAFLAENKEDIPKIKLIIGTNMKGYWDLNDIIKGKCQEHGMNHDDIMGCFVQIKNPQKLSDKDINTLYNVADVGINTCDGEGFGLCNFEQAFIGIPQIVPNLGGFKSNINEIIQFQP
jgi:D-inositol-3-phosphate glycosyltransferase